MSNVFRSVSEITPLRIWDAVSARPLQGEHVTLAVIELEPDSHVPEHSHPNEQVGIMVEGSCRIRVGDEEIEGPRGTTWIIPSGVPHEFWTGPDGALIAECFAPPRQDWKSLPELAQSAARWPA